MGEFVISHNDDTLVALGLGSCIGICIIDEEKGIGGLAHIMLPSSKDCTETSNKNKFADSAIPAMIQGLISAGARREKLKAKIAGGAHMFTSIMDEDSMNIGKRNAEAVISILETEHIPIMAKDVGGSTGRTVRIELSTRKFIVKTKDGMKEI